MGLFDFLKKSKAETKQTHVEIVTSSTEPKVVPKTEKHHVAGVASYIENIMALAVENSDYSMKKKEIIDNYMDGEKVYQYLFYPGKVELVEEPTNEFDPNAIKVVVDDLHVGYIKKGSCSHIKKLLSNGSIEALGVEIVGGKYKVYYEDDEAPGGYELIKDENRIGIILEITLN